MLADSYAITKVDAAISVIGSGTAAVDIATTGRRILRLPGDKRLQLAQRSALRLSSISQGNKTRRLIVLASTSNMMLNVNFQQVVKEL